MFLELDPEIFYPADSVLRKQVFNGDDVLIIGYAGRISDTKGVHLIPAVAGRVIPKFPNARFWIVGEPFLQQDNGILEKIHEETVQRGLEKHIVFSGFQNNMVDVIRGFDILILPSRNEPFGRILVEAMAVEKPVIASRCGGPLEIVTDGVTGFLVPVQDIEAIADRIVSLLDDRDLRNAMGKKGRKHVRRSFSLDQHLDEFLRIHNNLINRKQQVHQNQGNNLVQ